MSKRPTQTARSLHPFVSASLIACAISIIACSTGTYGQGGMSMSGVTSTVDDTIGTPEEREARRQAKEAEKLAQMCKPEKAKKTGIRHARWARIQDPSYLDACPEADRAMLKQTYEVAYAAEYKIVMANHADMQACDPELSYERGYNDAIAGGPRDSTYTTKCFLDEEEPAQQAYGQGYDDGVASAQAVIAAETEQVQSAVCDAQRAFELGQNDGRAHAAMSSAYLDQCADEDKREEARVQYMMGYQIGFGLGVVDDAQAHEANLQKRLSRLSGDQRRMCDFNVALEQGYNDGRAGADQNSGLSDECTDTMLRQESKNRYQAGYAQGRDDRVAQQASDEAQQSEQDKLCDTDTSYERGFNDGQLRRPMDSSWLSRCKVDVARKAAKSSYRKGYRDALK